MSSPQVRKPKSLSENVGSLRRMTRLIIDERTGPSLLRCKPERVLVTKRLIVARSEMGSSDSPFSGSLRRRLRGRLSVDSRTLRQLAARVPFTWSTTIRPSAARAIRTRRLGLTSMRERAHDLGGEVAVDSAPGAGTTVRLTVPTRTAAP